MPPQAEAGTRSCGRALDPSSQRRKGPREGRVNDEVVPDLVKRPNQLYRVNAESGWIASDDGGVYPDPRPACYALVSHRRSLPSASADGDSSTVIDLGSGLDLGAYAELLVHSPAAGLAHDLAPDWIGYERADGVSHCRASPGGILYGLKSRCTVK